LTASRDIRCPAVTACPSNTEGTESQVIGMVANANDTPTDGLPVTVLLVTEARRLW